MSLKLQLRFNLPSADFNFIFWIKLETIHKKFLIAISFTFSIMIQKNRLCFAIQKNCCFKRGNFPSEKSSTLKCKLKSFVKMQKRIFIKACFAIYLHSLLVQSFKLNIEFNTKKSSLKHLLNFYANKFLLFFARESLKLQIDSQSILMSLPFKKKAFACRSMQISPLPRLCFILLIIERFRLSQQVLSGTLQEPFMKMLNNKHLQSNIQIKKRVA